MLYPPEAAAFQPLLRAASAVLLARLRQGFAMSSATVASLLLRWSRLQAHDVCDDVVSIFFGDEKIWHRGVGCLQPYG